MMSSFEEASCFHLQVHYSEMEAASYIYSKTDTFISPALITSNVYSKLFTFPRIYLHFYKQITLTSETYLLRITIILKWKMVFLL